MEEEKNAIKLFDNKKIRVEWDSDKEKWYFSVVDVVAVLTDTDFQGARNYWKVLKHRLKAEGNQMVTDCNQLKMVANDSKMRLTDIAKTKIFHSKEAAKQQFEEWMTSVPLSDPQESF